jgi:hypothetical protein
LGTGWELGEKMGGVSAEKDLTPLRIGTKAAGGVMTSMRTPSAEKWYAFAIVSLQRNAEVYTSVLIGYPECAILEED